VTDREIWNEIRSRNARVFEETYRENAPRLQRFLHQMVRDRQVCEDIVQEIFIQIWNRPVGYDPDRGALTSYLFGVAKKRAADWWRRQRLSESVSDEDSKAGGVEASSIIGEAFGHLPEEQRTLLWLREVEGQSYAELAAILEIPIGTVRSRLFAAREALREIWLSKGVNQWTTT
jgi:RNA polymerase sigma-70 factor, ECF subfamily